MTIEEKSICSFCVMDISVPDIIFDENHQCQYCKNHLQRVIFEKNSYPNYILQINY